MSEVALQAIGTYAPRPKTPKTPKHLKLVGSSVRPKLWEQMPVDVHSGGVTVHLDSREEDSYIDCAIGYDQAALVTLVRAMPSYGFELLSEDECPPETLDDGTVRIWLAEVVG